MKDRVGLGRFFPEGLPAYRNIFSGNRIGHGNPCRREPAMFDCDPAGFLKQFLPVPDPYDRRVDPAQYLMDPVQASNPKFLLPPIGDIH